MARLATNHEAERRLILLKAAFREVAEKGFSNVTLEDIAARAAVSKGVTLYYFSSKEDLFRELFAWLIDSIHERMREAVASVEDPVGKIRALLAAARWTEASSKRGCGGESSWLAIPGRQPRHCAPSSTV